MGVLDLLAGARLDDDVVDALTGQQVRQHQPGRSAADDADSGALTRGHRTPPQRRRSRAARRPDTGWSAPTSAGPEWLSGEVRRIWWTSLSPWRNRLVRGRDQALVEVGVIEWHGVIAVAHAMRPARTKYLR